MKPIISLIAAASENDVIGKNNQLIWHLPNDLKYFQDQTAGKPVIMGRKTFDAIISEIGKPLPKRQNIVMTRDESFYAEGVLIANNLQDAIQLAGNVPEIMIIGGGYIYTEALAIADKIQLTRVHHVFEGDAFFPKIDTMQWELHTEERHEVDENHAYAYTFMIYTRK